ncbi:MAG: antibiotic biosynthesis monooxygenase [Chloroflexota bacterium]
MYIVCVQCHIKPEFVDDFIRVTHENHEGTRTTEPGNVRWDCLQAEDDPTRFFLYEVYHSKEDFPIHQQTAHYLRWKEAVADMMVEPRVGTRFLNVYPTNDSWNS